jgi:hypothetical protein
MDCEISGKPASRSFPDTGLFSAEFKLSFMAVPPVKKITYKEVKRQARIALPV